MTLSLSQEISSLPVRAWRAHQVIVVHDPEGIEFCVS
jgi:hypothetical protein